MMLVGAAAVAWMAVVAVSAAAAGPLRSACLDGGKAPPAPSDMDIDMGMTLGIVMSVRSGAGPASTESMGTVTRLGM